MTIILSKEYGAREAIAKRSIPCVSQEEADREDIRALRIGCIQLAPADEESEINLMHPMGRSVMQIEPVWIRLKTAMPDARSPAEAGHEQVAFEDAIEQRGLDGLVLTGDSASDADFETRAAWPELSRILRYARNNIPSTLGISGGAQAVAAFLGMQSRSLDRKIFGVFEARNLDTLHRITCVMDDVFFCPQNRQSAVPDTILESERDRGNLALLAHGADTGYLLAVTPDQRFVLHFGNPEYEAVTIVNLFADDQARVGAASVPPHNFDISRPANCWRAHRTALFDEWIKYIHETTSY